MTWCIFLCQKRISNPIVHITKMNYHNKKVVRDMVQLLMMQMDVNEIRNIHNPTRFGHTRLVMLVLYWRWKRRCGSRMGNNSVQQYVVVLAVNELSGGEEFLDQSAPPYLESSPFWNVNSQLEYDTIWMRQMIHATWMRLCTGRKWGITDDLKYIPMYYGYP